MYAINIYMVYVCITRRVVDVRTHAYLFLIMIRDHHVGILLGCKFPNTLSQRTSNVELWYFLCCTPELYQTNGWIKSGVVGDLRRHVAHAMSLWCTLSFITIYVHGCLCICTRYSYISEWIIMNIMYSFKFLCTYCIFWRCIICVIISCVFKWHEIYTHCLYIHIYCQVLYL